jgi:hypothetical protein
MYLYIDAKYHDQELLSNTCVCAHVLYINHKKPFLSTLVLFVNLTIDIDM